MTCVRSSSPSAFSAVSSSAKNSGSGSAVAPRSGFAVAVSMSRSGSGSQPVSASRRPKIVLGQSFYPNGGCMIFDAPLQP
jgi:hypothetical protein